MRVTRALYMKCRSAIRARWTTPDEKAVMQAIVTSDRRGGYSAPKAMIDQARAIFSQGTKKREREP